MNGSQRVRVLYGLLRGGNEQPEVMNTILRLIKEDREARLTYLHLVHMEVNLPWIVDARPTSETSILREVQRQVNSRRRLQFWGVASSLITAIILIGVGVARYQQSLQVDNAVAPIVAMIELENASESGGAERSRRLTMLRAETPFVLLQGQATIHTQGRSDIVLTAPLRMEMSDARSLTLRQGALVAGISKADTGFLIRTPGANFIDLGTILGVSVDPAGASELHVFDGMVSAESAFTDSRENPRYVSTGNTLGYSAHGDLQAVSVKTSQRLIPLLNRLHGIEELTGDIRHLPLSPASTRPGELTSAEVIHLIPEQRDVELMSDLQVVPPTIGRLSDPDMFSEVTLPAGTRCSSILLHAQCMGFHTPWKGTIRFDRPILGIVISTERLFESDPVFQRPDMLYPEWDDVVARSLSRGSLIGFRGTTDKGDIIHIHDDQHTLSVDLRAGSGNLDQIRIIVDSSSPHN